MHGYIYNRARPLFKKNIPVIKSLANAGWEPMPMAKTDANIWLEQFGSPENEWWMTLYNPTENILSGWLELDDKTNRWTGFLPLTDSYIFQNLEGKFPFAIASEDVLIIKLEKESLVLPKKYADSLMSSIVSSSVFSPELISI